MSGKLRIGIIGYGALGQAVEAILRTSGRCTLGAVLVPSPRDVPPGVRLAHNLPDFLALGHDIVVECAGQATLRQYAVGILDAGVHLVPASVGALADDALRGDVATAARRRGVEVRLPSGAIAGIDGLVAARAVGIDGVLYRGTMPPGVLRGIEPLAAGAGKTQVFSGTARDAVVRFPKNANLTATIALASVGLDRTRVEFHVDPAETSNLHELEAHGAFGAFHVAVRGTRISEASPSSRIVPGSLAQAALGLTHSLLSID